jgi:ornithine cyclodeaminase/alanine dehydrogenase-like protein (mu-crystallin family)
MPIRLLTGSDIERLLPMSSAIAAMEEALRALAQGRAILPLRTVIRLPGGRGAFAAMPAQLDQPNGFGLKVISVFPGNEGTRWDSHQGAVLLFEPEHGTLAAIMDASVLTAIRTAAVSGLATRLLARPDAGDLALLGSGVQARSHLEAMAAVRKLRRVRVWSRQPANREAFVNWARDRVGCPVEATASGVEAVRDADLICTVTSSRQPVLLGEWIADGAHVNAVGSSLPEARELDSSAVAGSRLYVDRRESAVAEAGDFLIPRSEGVITDAHIVGEVGEILTGAAPGRESAAEVTLFKSLGLAIEDVAAAHLVHREAERQGVGLVVELGGVREEEEEG